MRLKFDPSLEYQRDAVDAVVHTFAGQPIAQTDFAVSAQADNALKLSELGVGNSITLVDKFPPLEYLSQGASIWRN